MVNLKSIHPTANTATAFQDLRTIKHQVVIPRNERITISGLTDRTELPFKDEAWAWQFLVPGTAGAGTGSLSALYTMYNATAQAATGVSASANLVQVVWVDPALNAAVTATAFFSRLGEPEYLTPYTFVVEAAFRRYQGP
jgi:hypothetical protein